jgi:tripartite-type tricarboxylate transporter receptor subunit TctC
MSNKIKYLSYSVFLCAPSLLQAQTASSGAGQTYPVQPIRFIVGFPPGGANDIIARALGQKLTEQMGQQWVVENRPGANTVIATEMFVRQPADGYNI